jgi:FAD/FMN-containing dehydrogenase/Fe-S oxidoreductase
MATVGDWKSDADLAAPRTAAALGGRVDRLKRDDHRAAEDVDVEGLARALRAGVRGEVRFDEGSRALYATDASNYRQAPLGVVLPRDVDDVVAAVDAVRRFGAPLLSRGGGTSLAGQCCNSGVVLDFSKYMGEVLEVDARRRLARVQPGCVLDRLRATAERQGLTFGPDPATHSHCTLGGMLGNNSCGVHSLLSLNHGLGLRTSDNTHALEVLTYDGVRLRVGETPDEAFQAVVAGGGRPAAIYTALRELRDDHAAEIRRRFPKLPRRVSGYNLDDLLPENGFHLARALVGSESTCVTILEAAVHLVPAPAARTLVVLGYPDAAAAAEHLTEILEHRPIGLEGLDHLLLRYVREKGDHTPDLLVLPDGRGFLLVEFGGESQADADEQARRLMRRLERRRDAPSMKLFDDPDQAQKVWEVREGGLGSTAWVPGLPDMWPGFEDSAVQPDKVAPYLRALRSLFQKYGHEPSLYGHYGQGCIHCRVSFDLYTAQGLRSYREFMDEASDLVLRFGGSLSGEHGDGQARGELLEKMFGARVVQAFREFKRAWDPQGRMNPGKVVDAYPILSNLRLGPDYNPPQPRTHFQYPDDRHAFSRAVLRCVGVGKCRRDGGGTMCPSFMATREEKHSTRGRARLLFEMMNGEVITEGWRSRAVKEALDLCLACKGCKSDCPVNVDMATYKAEFLSHYYQAEARPRHAYAFGLIPIWARLAALSPVAANLVTQTPGLRELAKAAAGVAPARRLPAFAPQSFRSWFSRRLRRPDGRPVVLWADTFNNYFHPETARHAVEVLEAAGFAVTLPPGALCCGRPLYDYGFLDLAKKWLRRTLAALQPALRAGTPVVVLEPSCAAVFRDELVNLFPADRDARKLHDQTVLLSELLERHAPGWRPPRLDRPALLHGHCHQKAIMGLDDTAACLRRAGVQARVPESGCCGMAGAFGFEGGEHYEVSLRCGERVLLPEVRAAGDETMIVADGFSCREQISPCTLRMCCTSPCRGQRSAAARRRASSRSEAGPRPGRGSVRRWPRAGSWPEGWRSAWPSATRGRPIELLSADAAPPLHPTTPGR